MSWMSVVKQRKGRTMDKVDVRGRSESSVKQRMKVKEEKKKRNTHSFTLDMGREKEAGKETGDQSMGEV
jgi:hypothetical protein